MQALLPAFRSFSLFSRAKRRHFIKQFITSNIRKQCKFFVFQNIHDVNERIRALRPPIPTVHLRGRGPNHSCPLHMVRCVTLTLQNVAQDSFTEALAKEVLPAWKIRVRVLRVTDSRRIAQAVSYAVPECQSRGDAHEQYVRRCVRCTVRCIHQHRCVE